MAKAKKKEQTRQEKLHESLKKAARKKQEEEAARIREEKKAQAKADAEAAAEASQAQEVDPIEEEESETSAEDIKDDFKEKIDMLKKRMREVELSMKMVEETTKRCPGCQWPIEKNEGCDHMTCKSSFLSFQFFDSFPFSFPPMDLILLSPVSPEHALTDSIPRHQMQTGVLLDLSGELEYAYPAVQAIDTYSLLFSFVEYVLTNRIDKV